MGEGPGPSVFFAGSGNGYRLSAQGLRTLQAFLREHGADCVRQFMQVCLGSPIVLEVRGVISIELISSSVSTGILCSIYLYAYYLLFYNPELIPCTSSLGRVT